MRCDIDENVLSQLVDGELDSDRANEVLQQVLDDAAARDRLKEHLRLRQAMGQWRNQSPRRTVVAVQGAAQGPRSRLWRRFASLAAAAVVGAALTAAGILIASRGDDGVAVGPNQAADAVVTPEQMAQVARVFEFHESVAGPLRWYAADEQHVRLGSASSGHASGRPVAIVLRLSSAGEEVTPSRTYVIVCRDSASASIDLPSRADDPQLRLYVQPVARDGTVDVRYAIGFAGPGPDRGPAAALAGRRQVGLKQTPLGQFVQDDRLLKVDASAWVLGPGEVR